MAQLRAAAAYLLSIFIAYIFIDYLQYKFTGHPGSVWLFTVLTDWLGASGYEKVMRIGTGSAELVAAVLGLIPATQVLGALGAVAIMAGAIFFHLVSPLGIDPYKDGGVLFTEACAVLVAGGLVLVLRRDQARLWLEWLRLQAGTGRADPGRANPT